MADQVEMNRAIDAVSSFLVVFSGYREPVKGAAILLAHFEPLYSLMVFNFDL